MYPLQPKVTTRFYASAVDDEATWSFEDEEADGFSVAGWQIRGGLLVVQLQKVEWLEAPTPPDDNSIPDA